MFIAFAFGFLGTTVFATDRIYLDHKGQSPSGTYEAEAKSPDNQGQKGYASFQDDFTVTFRNTILSKTIWQWKQGPRDASPVELFPSDDAFLVMLDANASFHVFDPNGVKKKVFEALKTLPRKEMKKYVSDTTAGYLWRQHSQTGFIKHNESTFFHVRLYWGRLFIIDIAGAKLVQDNIIGQRIETEIVQQTRELIKSFNGEYYGKHHPSGRYYLRGDLTDALFIIKRHYLSEGHNLFNEVLKRANRGNRLKHYLNRVELGQTPIISPIAKSTGPHDSELIRRIRAEIILVVIVALTVLAIVIIAPKQRVIPASLQNLKKVCGGGFLGGAAGLTAQPISGV